MGVLRTVSGAVLALAALGGAGAGAGEGDAELRRDLLALAQRQVFFGHQSVGDNLIEGLVELATAQGVPLRVVAVERGTTASSGTFGHGRMERNGDPSLKLASFERALAEGPPEGPEVAFLKLCFVDIQEGTDVRALFASYQQRMAALAARYPRTKFVHFTVPLMTVQPGLKARLKRLLGRVPYDFLQNAKREEYNGLVREAYRGREPLFDLAVLESTRPDGTRALDSWENRSVPVLAGDYAADEGHLNALGRRKAARELASILAALPAGHEQTAVR